MWWGVAGWGKIPNCGYILRIWSNKNDHIEIKMTILKKYQPYYEILEPYLKISGHIG